MTTLQPHHTPSTAQMPLCVDGIALRCPRCGGNFVSSELESLSDKSEHDCEECRFTLRLDDGIWRALPPERISYFSQFAADYQSIRSSEGRGSEGPAYYLNLPYRDTTGHNSAQWKIRARTFEFLSKSMLPSTLAGGRTKPRILDIGAGNGWLSYRLATQGFCPTAVDILVNNHDGLGAAKHYTQHIPALFPRFQAESAHLPFAHEQFAAVVFNASFHYAEDYATTLKEALRCTRIGGVVIIADSPWYSDGASGEQMLVERRSAFLKRFGTASDAIASLAYLTDDRLRDLERSCNIRWQRSTPHYGLRWAMRPWLAKLRGRREPASFLIHSARKVS